MTRLSDVRTRILNRLADGRYYSAQSLGNLIGLSDRTIRKELAELNDILASHGAVIETKVRHGCRLNVTDPKRFNELKQSLRVRDQSRVVISSEEQRAHAVIRYVLCTEEKLQLSDLAEMLYTNETAVKNAVREARNIIRDFHVRLVSGRGGISMSGKEHDLRTLLTYESEPYSYSFETDTESEPYSLLYDFEREQLEGISRTIIEKLKFTDNYNLSMYSIDYIARIILISHTRNAMGLMLEYSANEIMRFTEFRSFLLASQILRTCEEMLDCKFTENDTILVTICLAGLRIITEYDENISKNYLAARRFAIELVDHVSQLNRFELLRTDNRLINDISFFIMSYMFRADYHIFTCQLVFRRRNELFPMPVKMAIQAFMYLYQEYQIPYRAEEIIRLALLIHPALGRHRPEIIHLNALVVSDVDISDGRGIAERLDRSFGKTLERIDVMQSYELNEKDLSGYDMLFTSYEPEYLAENVQKQLPPVYRLKPYFRNADKNSIYRFLLERINYKSRDGKQFAYLSERNLCYDVHASSKQDIIRLLGEFIENDIDSASQLESELEIIEYILPTPAENNVVLLSGLSSHAENVMVAVLVLERFVQWGENKVQFVVFWDQGKADAEASMFEFGFFPNFLQSVFRRQDVIAALMRKEPADVINQMISDYRVQISPQEERDLQEE
ncbi:MAG: hypothetical protein E7190_05310 [Erysipelotrichaceae bacterium]|nr:hypothetical protein [Erysipelotrichaceae bacterium]